MSEEVVYVCNSCGEGFSLYDSDHEYNDGEPVTVCPVCHSYDIEEGKRCMACQDIYYEYEITAGVCRDCFNDAVSAWKSCISYLKPWEREVLEYEFGSLDITEK